MTEEPLIFCKCGKKMHRVIGAPNVVLVRWGNRSVKTPDRPSNEEYRAYKDWEAAGGEPGTYEHKAYIASRGDGRE